MHNYFPILIQDQDGKFMCFEKANVLFAYVGTDSFKVIETNFSSTDVCPYCNGTKYFSLFGGIDNKVPCSLCSGTGKLEIQKIL